jgi:hypothetical protein
MGEGISSEAILAALGSAAKVPLPDEKTKVTAAPAADNLRKSLLFVGIGMFDGRLAALTPGETVAPRSAEGRPGQEGAHNILALSPDFGNGNNVQGNGCFRVEHLVCVCGHHRKKESNHVLVMAKVRSGLILEDHLCVSFDVTVDWRR